jgi:hypothetical protein
MTRYTVVWSIPAQNQLARIWIDSDQRQAITAAADAIDARLATDPSTKGEPLKEGLRTLDVPPLHALFEVQELDRIVRGGNASCRRRLGWGPQVNGEG